MLYIQRIILGNVLYKLHNIFQGIQVYKKSIVCYNCSMSAKGPSWKLRRRAVFGSLIFSMLLIVYVVFRWDSTRLAETLVIGAFALIGTVVAAYIGGAVYEDVRLTRNQDIRLPTEEEEQL
jgi:hypothetical protein